MYYLGCINDIVLIVYLKLYEKVITLAKELISSNDSLPLQLLIESTNVDSPGKCYKPRIFTCI